MKSERNEREQSDGAFEREKENNRNGQSDGTKENRNGTRK